MLIIYAYVYVGNKLGGLGLTALCRGLAINKTLTHLELADNGIDSVCIYICLYAHVIMLML